MVDAHSYLGSLITLLLLSFAPAVKNETNVLRSSPQLSWTPEVLSVLHAKPRSSWTPDMVLVCKKAYESSSVLDESIIRTCQSFGIFEEVYVREKRGFGPWEAQDTWDEKGKSNIKVTMEKMVKELTEEVEVLKKEAEEVLDEIAHPIRTLYGTRLGKVVLVVIVAALFMVLLALIQPCYIIFKFVFKALLTCWKFIFKCNFRVLKFVFSTSCCVILFTFFPLRMIRDKYLEWLEERRLARKARDLRVFDEDAEEIDMITRVFSDVYTDEIGAYLQAPNNVRVYIKKERLVEDVLQLKTFAPSEREIEGSIKTVKESVLQTSKIYKNDKLPDFQGQFDVGGVTVGHFARIKYLGHDCILTAYHVLDYNRDASIRLKKGKNMVNFDTSLDTSVIAASTTDYLDYIVIKVPTYVFSALGLKVGNWSARVMPREPISIHQLYEGNPCFSTASIRLYGDKPWHVAYNASTLVGSSGAPILDSRNNIIGIHLESDAVQKCNVGIVPPIFRSVKKESPTNEDLMQHERNIYEDGLYEDGDGYDEYQAFEQDYIDELEERYYTFAKQIRKEQSSGNWAEDMDALDEIVDSFLEEDTFENPRGIGTGNFQVSRLIERRSKPIARVYSDRFNKESPWTCGYCTTVNTKLTHYCIKCHKGFRRIKNKSDIQALAKDQGQAIKENVQVPYPVALAVSKQMEAASMDKQVATIVAKSLTTGFIAKTDLKILSKACDLPEVEVDKNLIQQRMCANNCHVNSDNRGKKKYKGHLLPCVCTEEGDCPYEKTRPYTYQFWHSSGHNPEYVVENYKDGVIESKYKADAIKVVDQSGEKFLTVRKIEEKYEIPKAMEDLGVPIKKEVYVNRPIVKLKPVKATKPETIPEIEEGLIENSFDKLEKTLSDRTKNEIPPTETGKKVRRRSRRKKSTKESQDSTDKLTVTFSEAPKVSLNSTAPAQTGAFHTNGQNPSSSQNNQSKSGDLPVASNPANKITSRRSGKVSSQRNQSMINMAGQKGQQKLKN